MKLGKATVPAIGLYGCCSSEICLLGRDMAHAVPQVKRITGLDPILCSISGSSLLGIFAVLDGKNILLPQTVLPQEVVFLEQQGLTCHIIEAKETALGNLIAVGQGILASDELSAVVKKRVRQALDKPLRPGLIAGLPQVGQLAMPLAAPQGSSNSASSFGFVAATISDEELSYAESALGLRLFRVTVNRGVVHMRSGLLGNAHGLLIGSACTPIEVQQLYDASLEMTS
ncbi:hypothetical protein AUJ68_06110 [Candidatus Woesearchaeota archaeon CG1_02_57_44]|nr:MAG: hypothetical protein AUJ68_06110 [Candidatus Woesearchaeota archaeon CG1_02_57_44]